MESAWLIGGLLLVVVLNVAALWYFLVHQPKKQQAQDQENEQKEADRSFLLIQQQLQELSRTVDSRINESAKTMHESLRTQMSESNRIIREVTEGLTKLDETNKPVVSFADQLQNLQNILKNPKQRGVLGEYYLETVLKNVLPATSYQMQYGFSNGEIVDAVVFVKDRIVPIDSKFSLENYNRMVETDDKELKASIEKTFINDLKLRIQETAKYIRPAEGTTDFAFMFIPSEGIYYDLLTNTVGGDESLIQRAASKYKVIIVSPTSFLAYLQTVLQGLKALQIEEKAQDIIKNVEKLGKHINKYDEYYQKLGNALGTVVNHYNAGYKELSKVDKDITRITGETADIDPLALPKPERE
jgi:DNA recombination protein RmuC